MAPPYTVIVIKVARDQLADLHLKYHQLGQWGRIAFADHKIFSALEANPQGGQPALGANLWTVTVRPLRAIYEIVGDEVRVLRYEEVPPP